MLPMILSTCKTHQKHDNPRSRSGKVGRMDMVPRKRRSEIMRLVKAHDTRPEIAVRAILHRLGFRFRLRSKGLPCKPDVVLPKWKTAVFVHGCFWHRHAYCPNTRTPKSRVRFWNEKFKENLARDKRAKKQLEKLGWTEMHTWWTHSRLASSIRMRRSFRR